MALAVQLFAYAAFYVAAESAWRIGVSFLGSSLPVLYGPHGSFPLPQIHQACSLLSLFFCVVSPSRSTLHANNSHGSIFYLKSMFNCPLLSEAFPGYST